MAHAVQYRSFNAAKAATWNARRAVEEMERELATVRGYLESCEEALDEASQ